MQFRERLSFLFRIMLPLLVLVLFNAFPASQPVAEAQYRLAVARQTGSRAAIVENLRLILHHEPWRVTLWEALGREELNSGRVTEAIAAFKKGAQAGVLTEQGRFLLGEAYEQLGDDALAAAYWQSQMDETGPSAGVYERLAQLQRKQGNLADAVTTLRAWKDFEPGNAQAAFLLGLHLSAFSPDEALPLLLQAGQANSIYTPSVQTIRGALGLAASADDPAYGHLMVGRALGSLGHWDIAAAAFHQSLQLQEDYGEAWAFLGEAHHHLGKGGKTELDRAQQLAPQSPLVRALLSLYWRRQGDPDKALAYLEAVAQQEPDQPIWQVEIGNTLVEKGDLVAARERFEQVVKMEPKNSVYWQHLARFSIQNGVDIHGLGLEAARTAVLLAPNDASALDTMGWALLSLGDYVSAERFLQRAFEKEPTNRPVLLHLGQLYLQKQDSVQARTYLQRAAKNTGDDAVGLIARRLLQQYFGEGG